MPATASSSSASRRLRWRASIWSRPSCRRSGVRAARPRAVRRSRPGAARRQSASQAGAGREPYAGARGSPGPVRRQIRSRHGRSLHACAWAGAASVRSACSVTPNRSTSPRPRCRKGRRSISAGGALCTGFRARKGPSASRPNGGGKARHAATRDYFRVEDAGGAPLLALSAGPLWRLGGTAALVHAWDFRMNAIAALPYAEFAVQSNFSFLRGASKSGGTGGHRRSCSAFRLSGLPTATGCRRRARLAAGQGGGTSPIIREPAGVLRTARPTCSPIRRTARLGASVPHADQGQPCAARKGAPDLSPRRSRRMGRKPVAGRAADIRRRPPSTTKLLAALQDRFGRPSGLPSRRSIRGNDRFRLEQAASAGGVRRRAADGGQRRALPRCRNGARCRTCSPPSGSTRRSPRPGLPSDRTPSASQAAGRDGAAFPPPSRALAETLRFAATLSTSRWRTCDYNYPDEPTESGLPPQEELERLTWEGAAERYPDGVPDKVARPSVHELRRSRSSTTPAIS